MSSGPALAVTREGALAIRDRDQERDQKTGCEARRLTAHGADRVYRLPPHAPGQRIGLLGGSFDPPHPGHRLVSLLALRRLALDRVWWLVTPGNPLKDTAGLPPLACRIAAAERLARHPRIAVTGIEAAFGTRYTVDLLQKLVSTCPGTHFVWLMGADNLREFHRWKNWRRIASLVPIAIVDRAGSLDAAAAPAAQALAPWRRRETTAKGLARARPPAWVYLFGVKSPLSSTALRLKKEQPRG